MDTRVDYNVVVHHEEDSYWAEVDGLPGCFAAGDTVDELRESLEDSVTAYLATDGSTATVRIARIELSDPPVISESMDAKIAVLT